MSLSDLVDKRLINIYRVYDMTNKNNRKKEVTPSGEFIIHICQLYDDVYDDREEDSKPKGEDWKPGVRANHMSLEAFRKKLKDACAIELSTAKIRKILITGGCWTTARSREIQKIFSKTKSISGVAEKLGVSTALVTMNLPYEKVVYDLKDKSGNAKRIEKWRKTHSKFVQFDIEDYYDYYGFTVDLNDLIAIGG